mgnify:CR=1 FL=1
MQLIYLYDDKKKLCDHAISHHWNYTVTKEINQLTQIEFNIDYKEPCVKDIKLEGYVKTVDGFFIIKEFNIDDEGTCTVYATYELPQIKDRVLRQFKHNASLTTMMAQAMTGTDWAVGYFDIDHKPWTPPTTAVEINQNYITRWQLLQSIMDAYKVEMEFDNVNKVIRVYPSGGIGENRGTYFFENLNISSFSYDSNTESYCNVLECYSKDNDGNDIHVTVEDYSYTTRRHVGIWKDERYKSEASLKSAGEKKLKELSQPIYNFQVTLADLQNAIPLTRNVFYFELGDNIVLSAKGIKGTYRVVKAVQNVDVPEQTIIELKSATSRLQSNLADNNRLLKDIINNYTEPEDVGTAIPVADVDDIADDILTP